MDVKALIETVAKEHGSEIHLKIGAAPLMRQNKNLKRLSMPAVLPADMDGMVSALLSKEEQKKFAETQCFEANFFGTLSCNYRVNLFKAQGLTQALIRILRGAAPTVTELGFPNIFSDLTDARMGLLILSGPARSGISTSLAALIERINLQRASHILALEDPIEYTFMPKKSMISQRQLRKDLHTVEQGINFAKRMDVDVLVIGDLKREVPMRAILEYVNGGHFVILTMQTLGVQNTLEKILISFPEKDRDHICNMLSHDLLGVCSQALLFDPGAKKMSPIHELLIVNNTIRGILAKGRINQIESNISSAGEGSRLFDAVIGRLVREQKLTKDVADGFLGLYKGTRG